MNARDAHKAIYEAAKNNDEAALTPILKHAAIGVILVEGELKISPVFKLAREGDHDAVRFLLKHGAHINDAVAGYAISGDAAEVNALLQQGAKPHVAITFYAMGNHVQHVNGLLPSEKESSLRDFIKLQQAIGKSAESIYEIVKKREPRMIDEAVYGYAMGGHVKEVQALLEKGADELVAAKGYAVGGHLKEAKELFDDEDSRLTKEQAQELIYHFARGGRENLVVAWGREWDARYDTALHGYAAGCHIDILETSSINKEWPIEMSMRRLQAYALAGHIDAVNAELVKNEFNAEFARLALRSYEIGGHNDAAKALTDLLAKRDAAKDLFTKITELEEYGVKLASDGHPRASAKAIKLAHDIRAQVHAFNENPDNADAITTKLNTLLADGKKAMGENRKFKDILAHIILGLTVIGLAVMGGKKFFSESKSGFLNQTKRQKILGDIEQEVKKITKPKP